MIPVLFGTKTTKLRHDFVNSVDGKTSALDRFAVSALDVLEKRNFSYAIPLTQRNDPDKFIRDRSKGYIKNSISSFVLASLLAIIFICISFTVPHIAATIVLSCFIGLFALSVFINLAQYFCINGPGKRVLRDEIVQMAKELDDCNSRDVDHSFTLKYPYLALYNAQKMIEGALTTDTAPDQLQAWSEILSEFRVKLNAESSTVTSDQKAALIKFLTAIYVVFAYDGLISNKFKQSLLAEISRLGIQLRINDDLKFIIDCEWDKHKVEFKRSGIDLSATNAGNSVNTGVFERCNRYGARYQRMFSGTKNDVGNDVLFNACYKDLRDALQKNPEQVSEDLVDFKPVLAKFRALPADNVREKQKMDFLQFLACLNVSQIRGDALIDRRSELAEKFAVGMKALESDNNLKEVVDSIRRNFDEDLLDFDSYGRSTKTPSTSGVFVCSNDNRMHHCEHQRGEVN